MSLDRSYAYFVWYVQWIHFLPEELSKLGQEIKNTWKGLEQLVPFQIAREQAEDMW